MASNNKSEHVLDFNVTMTCGGCSGAINNKLKRENLKSYDVSLENQTVHIVTDEITEGEKDITYQTLLGKIKATGKTVNSGKYDGVPQSV